MKPSFLGIIPARYASIRLPGKPLIEIDGKTMIQRVWEQASLSLEKLVVATDDDRIYNEVVKFGGYAINTNPAHQSGTDRCAEAAEIYKRDTGFLADVVVNIQGDEPFVAPEQISLLCAAFNQPDTLIATLIRKCTQTRDIFDPNQPKVVVDNVSNALYFSRNPIPYIRNKPREKWIHSSLHFKHIGMYAYRSSTLQELAKLEKSSLESTESLEQLRWLESGYRIKTVETTNETLSIDALEDLEQAKNTGLINSFILPQTE